MRTNTFSSAKPRGRTRRWSVTAPVAVVVLALPMIGALGSAAFAAPVSPPAALAENGKAAAPGQDEKAGTATTAAASASAERVRTTSSAAAPNQNTSATPYTNVGGVTTGANTTRYEVVNGRSGSPAVGGGQPSGDVRSPQPSSRADKNNTGANFTSTSNPYTSTRTGAPSLNGNGGGQQVGQPCAGCVGRADNKNPLGQAPNATDPNAGYECDRNHGIGRSNPAHTGCPRTTTPAKDCLGVVNGTATAADCAPPPPARDCLGVVNGTATMADCTPPPAARDCLGVVNGTATTADCTPPPPATDCLGVVNGTATAADCTPPQTIVGTNGGGAQAPGTSAPAVTTAVMDPVAGPPGSTTSPTHGSGSVSVRPAALPFTGSNAILFARSAALMLLIGVALFMSMRRNAPASG